MRNYRFFWVSVGSRETSEPRERLTLLSNQARFASSVLVGPIAQEDLAKNRVEWLRYMYVCSAQASTRKSQGMGAF